MIWSKKLNKKYLCDKKTYCKLEKDHNSGDPDDYDKEEERGDA